MPYSELYVHLVWTTYERWALIRHHIEQALWALIVAQCKKAGAVALRVGGMSDHIHLLARYGPSLALSELVGEIKGAGWYAMTRLTASLHGDHSAGKTATAPSRCAKATVPSWSATS